MTKKQQRLLVMLVLVVGGVWVWLQYGPRIKEWLSQQFSRAGKAAQPTPTEEESMFGQLAGLAGILGDLDLEALLNRDATITVDTSGLDWLSPNGNGAKGLGPILGTGSPIDQGPAEVVETLTRSSVPVGAAVAAGAGLTFPGWIPGVPAGGATLPVSRIPEAIAKLLAPLYIGLSPAVPEFLHDVGLKLGGTGLQKGWMTLVTKDGPFMIHADTRDCRDLAGRRITCPDPSEIIGVSQSTLDWYMK